MLDHEIGKLVDKSRVFGPAYTIVVPAEVELVVPQVGVVGADVEDDGEGAGRVDAGDEAVDDGLGGGDADSTGSLESKSEPR